MNFVNFKTALCTYITIVIMYLYYIVVEFFVEWVNNWYPSQTIVVNELS